MEHGHATDEKVARLQKRLEPINKRLAAMPEAERDQLYRGRFDQIDSNHDGKLDLQERAAWREKQRENYRQQAAARARPADGQH